MQMLLTSFDKERFEEFTRAGFWCNDTIYSLVAAHAQDAAAKVAILSSRNAFSYKALLDAANVLADDLAHRGLTAGDRVAVWLPNRIAVAVALVACSRNGYVCCPSLHRDHTAAEVATLLKRMRAACFIGQTGYGADADETDIFSLLAEVGSLKCSYRLGDAQGAFHEGIVGPRRLLRNSNPAPADPNRVLYLAFTSGTSGAPKGVMHSDNTLLANARALSRDWDISGKSVIYSLSPLSHNLGFGALIMTLLVGGEFVLHDLARGASIVDRIIETGTTFLVGVPTHAIDILGELKARKLPGLGRLKGFRISGASTPPAVIYGLLSYGVIPQSGYGMTETCSHQYTLPNDDPQLIAETCGRACAGYEVRIFRGDDPDQEAPVGAIGQIGGRGASLMLGYFDDQIATEASFNKDGWFLTGDMGWVDARGYLRVVGRKKDVIIRGGHNINPANIETLASQHDAIESVAAVPVPDERLGEKVCLAVVFRSDKSGTPDEILEHLHKAGLSKFDMPEYFLPLSEMPQTASGKPRKRDIVDRIAEGRLRPTPVRWSFKKA
jgi:acyl-CoA synthetase (AMP-forming)/AMP-acid ligase II